MITSSSVTYEDNKIETHSYYIFLNVSTASNNFKA